MPTFHEVGKAILTERMHQDEQWKNIDQYNTVGDFVRYMDHYMKKIDMSRPTEDILAGIREVTALGVAVMEKFGAPHREGYQLVTRAGTVFDEILSSEEYKDATGYGVQNAMDRVRYLADVAVNANAEDHEVLVKKVAAAAMAALTTDKAKCAQCGEKNCPGYNEECPRADMIVVPPELSDEQLDAIANHEVRGTVIERDTWYVVDETVREYDFGSKGSIAIYGVRRLWVSKSGGHRLIDNQGHAYYIPTGWLALEIARP